MQVLFWRVALLRQPPRLGMAHPLVKAAVPRWVVQPTRLREPGEELAALAMEWVPDWEQGKGLARKEECYELRVAKGLADREVSKEEELVAELQGVSATVPVRVREEELP